MASAAKNTQGNVVSQADFQAVLKERIREGVRETIETILDEISIYDGEGYAIKLSNDPVAVINAMHLTDADRVDIITQSNKYIGYIILVYDNDSYDVIHDYSESLTDFMLPIETFAESLIPQ